MLKSIFFILTPENLNNPEKIPFSGLSVFSSAGRKKWNADYLHPKKHLLKKENDVFLYVHKVK